MNRILSKISLFLCLTMLFSSLLFINGCSRSLPQENLEYSTFFSSSLYPVSHVEDDDLINAVFSEKYAILIRSQFPEGYWEAELRYWQQNLYLKQGGFTDENGAPITSSVSLEIYNYDGTILNTIHLEDVLNTSWKAPSVSICDDKTILVVMTCANTKNLDVTYEYAHFDLDGHLIGEVGILQPKNYMTLSQTAESDANGNIYLAGNNVTKNGSTPCIFVFSDKGSLRKTIELKDRVFSSFVKVGNTLYTASSSTDENGSSVVLLDEIKKNDLSFGKSYVLPQSSSEYTNIVGDSSCVYLCDSQRIVRYSLESQTTDTILNWSDVDAQKDNVMRMACLSEDRIAFLGHSPVMGIYDLVVLNGQDADPNKEKQELVLGGVDITDDPIINEIVYRFNMSHPDYRIQIVDYGAAYPYSDYGEERYDKIYESFYLAFLTKDGPDVLIDPYNVLPFLSLSTSTQFVDLSEYLFNDPAINISDYQEKRISASMVDGKLCSLPSAYSLFGLLCASKEDAPKIWTIDEFNDVISNIDSESIPISGSSAADLMKGALYYTLSDFVNYKTSEVHFDSAAFIQLLEWAKQYGTQSQDDSYTAVAQGNANYSVSSIASAFDFANTSIAVYKTDFSLAPFPTEKGDALLTQPAYRFSISAQCKSPDAAWDCVSELLTADMQKVLSRRYVPLRYDALDWAIKKASDEFSSTDAEMTERAMSKYYSYALEANSIGYSDMDIINLVLEEASSFFAGQKTSEEVAKLIQNRAQTLVNERQ